MQTFLPYADFEKSAKCLDYKRLGKQRVEAWQIYKALTVPGHGWRNHPIVKMWKGYEPTLLYYGIVICKEWICRGYKDTMLRRFEKKYLGHNNELPKWVGNKELHDSHKSNLLRKDNKYYSKFNWNVSDNLPYKWIK